MNITNETVQRYAKLANLEFSGEEADIMAHQLGDILDYVHKISELNLEDVPATERVFNTILPKREDVVQPSLGQKAALQNAPDQESGHFLVPKVINVK